jgi:hypothetical protein
MTDTQWNWYATQELAGMAARDGLRCPYCEQRTREIEVVLDECRLHCGLCNSDFSPADYHAALRRPSKTGLSTLYRPVGENELAKIERTGFARFPPRLAEQPIFYPVLTQDYADAIARNWNSTDPAHNYVGFVTRFQIRNEFLSNYEIQTAADKSTLEYWIPAEHLDSFNENIVGKIEVVAEFRNGQLVPQRTT